MPKDNIDYSNTIIYKIYCKDTSISDTYIGHTTNFLLRKQQHKYVSNNIKNVLKIYKTIRENGGWDNWNMVEIAKYNCNDSTEARIMEQKHYEEFNSSLNSNPPYVDNKKYYCINCNIQCAGPKAFLIHTNNSSHLKKMDNNINLNKETTDTTCHYKYNCIYCNYFTKILKDYNKHLSTAKHQKQINSDKIFQKTYNHNINQYTCECGKKYNHISSLCKHKKTCNLTINANLSEPDPQLKLNKQINPELIMELINQNKELQKSIIEQNKLITELVNKYN